MFDGITAIANERQSQIQRGYGTDHDAEHSDGELLEAADAYFWAAQGETDEARAAWPWNITGLHINTEVSSLAKAGALIAAEIDRRIAAGECKEGDFGHPFPKEVI